MILKAFQVTNKLDLDQIFQSHIGYRDLVSFRTSCDYMEGMQKNLSAMIHQLGPSMFFVTFTSVVC